MLAAFITEMLSDIITTIANFYTCCNANSLWDNHCAFDYILEQSQ